jgi:hypothetical protein
MPKKKKYYLIGFLLLCAAIIGYHFYAASQAEQQIDEAIQEQSAQNNSLSVQYSSIDVAPFSATISIRDLTVIFGNHIERTQHLLLDISYLDFLNIYIGGLSYGLDRLDQAGMTVIQASYVNRGGLEEIKLDTLNISYTGNVLDGLQSAVNKTNFVSSHSIEAQSAGLRILLPNTTLSKIVADEFLYSGSIPSGEQNFWKNGQHQFAMDSLTWTPSKSFQETYSFFIKGFGYPTDAIPFESVQLHSQPVPEDNTLKIESSIKSELALLSSSGLIKLETPLGNSELHNMRIRMTDFSDSFSNVLSNLERLLSISLPQTNDGITLKVEGTLSNPSIAEQ